MIETVKNNGISIASTNLNKLYSNEKEQQFFSFMDNILFLYLKIEHLAKRNCFNQYLKDDNVSLQSSHKYSKIKILFLKYNTYCNTIFCSRKTSV